MCPHRHRAIQYIHFDIIDIIAVTKFQGEHVQRGVKCAGLEKFKIFDRNGNGYTRWAHGY